MLQRLSRLHDALTTAGFAGGALCVAIVTGSFWYEVVARYFFNAPTTWSYDLASYVLCPMIFLALPELTRRKANISVSFLVDGLPQRHRAKLAALVLLVAGLVCLTGAWICGAETWRQFVRGVETISAVPIPKWWVSVFIPYGLLGSGVYFLRQFAGEMPAQAADLRVEL
jgi:TRAP-type C4-dicarboxylate transport system permease small subunit